MIHLSSSRRRRWQRQRQRRWRQSKSKSRSRSRCSSSNNRRTTGIMYDDNRPVQVGVVQQLPSLLLLLSEMFILIFSMVVGISRSSRSSSSSTGTMMMMMEVVCMTVVNGFSPPLQQQQLQPTSEPRRRHCFQQRRMFSSSSSLSSSSTTITATHLQQQQQQQISIDNNTKIRVKNTSSKRYSSTDKIKQRFIDWSQSNNNLKKKRKKKILWVDGNNVRGKNKFEWDMNELHTLIVEEFCCCSTTASCFDIDCVIVVWDHGHEPSIYSQTIKTTTTATTTTCDLDGDDREDEDCFNNDDNNDDSNNNNSNSSNSNKIYSKEKEIDLVVLFSGLTQRADDVLVKESKYLLENFLGSYDDDDDDDDDDDFDGTIDDWSSFAFVTSDRELRFKLQRQAALAAMSSPPISSSSFHTLLSSSSSSLSRSGRRGSTTKHQQRHHASNNMPMICDSRQFVELLKEQQQNQNQNQLGLQQQTSLNSPINNDSSLLVQKTLQETQDSINELISPKTMPTTTALSSSKTAENIRMKFHKRQQLARSRSRRRQWRRGRGVGGGGGSGLWGGGEKTWQRCILAESLRRAYDNEAQGSINTTIVKKTPGLSGGGNRGKSDFLLSLESILESSRGYKVLGKDRSRSSLQSSKHDDIFGPARLDKKQRRLLQNYNKLMAEKSSSQLPSFPQSEQQQPEDDEANNNQLLILGLGRVGEEVARMALESNKFDQVIGTVRSKSNGSDTRILDDRNNDKNTSDAQNKTIQRIVFAPTSVSDVLRQSTHVLFTIPLSSNPNPEMELIQQMVQEWYNSSFSSQTATSPKWLGLLSTTGVYGNHDGKWVTEDDSLLCGKDSNAYLYKQLEEDWMEMSIRHQQNRIVTEDVGDEAPHSQPPKPRVCIFRCAGIYDASRSALHTVYKQGYCPSPKLSSSTSDDEDGTVSKTNRIHSFDIARSVVKSMLQTRFTAATIGDNSQLPPYRIYNLADDLPETRSVVLDYAYGILFDHGFVNADGNIDGQEESEGDVDSLTVENRSLPTNSSKRRLSRRQRERKLVSNNRMKSELLSSSSEEDVGLKYPTFKEGLDAILVDPSTPWQGQE